MSRGPLPLPVSLTPPQQAVLERLVRASLTPQSWVSRARIVLMAAQGARNCAIAQTLGLTRDTVIDWRRRWTQAAPALAEVEAAPGEGKLQAAVEAVLKDAPRPGCPATFTPEQVCQILALACQTPESVGRPVTEWTPRELAEEAQQQGIVERISPRHVGRFLKSGGPEAPPCPVLAQRRAG